MRTTILETKEVEIKTLKVNAKVRYWEDAVINGITEESGSLVPFKNGDLWCPVIDIDSGVIIDWPKGCKAELHLKICDEGCYYLLDGEGSTIYCIEEDYVPSILCPKENGYGDYIIMDIDGNGQIANWKPDISSFMED